MNSVARLAVRQFSSSVVRSNNVPAGYSNLKNAQKMFNIDNGQRVHQRGGMKDGIIYNITLLLIGVGGVVWANTVYTLAFPKK